MTELSDREIDALVAEKVMELEVLDVGYFGSEDETPRMLELHDWMDDVGLESVGRYAIDVEKKWFREMSTGFGSWSPSTDISAAMEVVAHLEVQGYQWSFHRTAPVKSMHDNKPHAQFWTYDKGVFQGLHQATADTLPRAICMAALAATTPESLK